MRATGVRLACGTLLPQWSEEDFCRQDRYCKDSKEQTEWQIANV
uniref:Glutamate rich 2 n=1 Tax=Homo sapiens TaxID=9606 RepID=A0A8V8TMJ1_HUMAN